MTILGQPETYADILKRVFYCTLGTGIVCSVSLAQASPAVKALLDSIAIQGNFGPLKDVRLLYVVLPGIVALFSRVLRLHDRVSDLLGIRHRIDTIYILQALAVGAGVDLDDAQRLSLRLRRRDAMYKIFYPYVSLPGSRVDKQLVRTALDNYGWLWSILESLLLLIPTTVGLWLLQSSTLGLLATATDLTLLLLGTYQWHVCKEGTRAEVHAILDDPQRKSEVSVYLQSL